MVTDQPTTFAYGDQIYEPRNYKEEYHGDVTARYALAMSLNNATVKLAEEVGYDKVADLAKTAGIVSVKPTPAMALGAYDATPLDMAASLHGVRQLGTADFSLAGEFRAQRSGDVVMDWKPDRREVLDPRVAFVMTNMMEGVLNFGTAYKCAPSASPRPRQEKPELLMMAGSPAIPAICFALSGWASTITATFA